MAGEHTSPSKVISSGLEMSMDGGNGWQATVVTSPLSIESPVISLETFEVSGDQRISGEKFPDLGSKLSQISMSTIYVMGDGSRLPPRDGYGSSLGLGNTSVGSLFSTPSSSISPIILLFSTPSFTTSLIITFSSSPGQVSSQKGVLSSVITTSQFHNTNLYGGMTGTSMVTGQSPFPSTASSSQSVTIQESHLL